MLLLSFEARLCYARLCLVGARAVLKSVLLSSAPSCHGTQMLLTNTRAHTTKK